MPWVPHVGEVGLEELLGLLLLVRELQLQTSKGTIIFELFLFVQIAHALADGTHDGRGQLGSLEELGLGELVVSGRQLGPVFPEVVRLEEERQCLTDGALADRLVQPVLLEVHLDVKDRDRIRRWRLHLHDLRPEHRRLVLLGAVAVVVDAFVIGALGVVVVPAAAPPEEAAQLALYELHGTGDFGVVTESAI